MLRHAQLRAAIVTTVLIICVHQAVCPAFSSQPVSAELTASQQESGIESLEQRFFETTYKSDSEDQRLDRLEQMVFGEVKDGSDASRVAALLSAIKSPTPSPTPSSTPPANGTSSTSAAAPQQDTQSANQNGCGPSGANQGTANPAGANSNTPGGVPNSDDYPRVTALEQEMLGTTHRDWDIHRRLDALDTKAFGKPSTKDLADRVTKLESYAGRHGLAPRGGEDEDGSQPVATSGEPSINTPVQAKVAWLETEVYGASNPQDSMDDRLQKLDASVFPSDRSVLNEPLRENVDTLVNAVEFNKGLPQTIATPSGSYYQPGNGQSAPGYTPGQYYGAQTPYHQSQYPQTNVQYPQQPEQTDTQNNNTQAPKPKEHPLLRGLAHVAGAIGQMALSNVVGGGIGGFGGYGGVPGMGWGL